MDRSELAVRGASAACVTKEEVRRLILAARQAHQAQRALGLADEPFDDWRRGVLWDCCRKVSFRTLGQAEFGRAMAAFLRLAGRDPAAAPQAGTPWTRANAAIARRECSPEGDRRRAEHVLRQGCQEAAEAFGGDAAQAFAYALVLLRQIHRADLQGATAKQLMQTLFTLRTRSRARLKRQQAQKSPAAPENDNAGKRAYSPSDAFSGEPPVKTRPDASDARAGLSPRFPPLSRKESQA